MRNRSRRRSIGRRDFVRATGGLLATLPMLACEDALSPDAGFVRVTISGLLPGFTSAGTAIVEGNGLNATEIALGLTTSGELSVKAGDYLVHYTPPSGYAMAAGQSNLFEVTVVAQQTTDVALDVVPVTGTLRVNVTGLGGATSGGIAQALRTDVGGGAQIVTDLEVDGSTDRSIAPGTYSVTLIPPGGYAVNGGVQNPQSIVVPSNGTGTANFAVGVIAPPAAVLFHSDFGTGIGSTSAAVRDQNKTLPWNIQGGQGLEVISAAGLDFPTANVLRVTSLAATTGYAFLRRTGIPIPAVGESRFYRWYLRVTTPNGLEDPESHPMQDGNASSQSNWLFHIYHDGGGAGFWRPQFRPAASANAYPNDRWNGPALSKNVTYRFELQIQRTATNSFQMHVRVYNAAGALLHGDSAFTNQENTGTLAGNPTFSFLNLAALDGLNAGCNGIAGSSPPFPFVYAYQGAFAVGSQDWMGPYAGGI